ncbi:hemerythrin domain-containing protein [Lutibaculum baratangense]|uniref:Hemerythrin-like domain-containing protein n=1 Tax=Lutibaculum baratangense AMV1 TaxID=631454 RepID=V4TID1_9HYPH|nr:hemerythrin domain-containing protein [Lutibaculum baratangense]ESR25763.1 hypothetical protein N177_1596 [Lutibaculum baratangense AMV1]
MPSPATEARAGGPRRSRQYLDALPVGLLSKPLAYLMADHLRQRVLCHVLDRLAEEDETDAGAAADVAWHLQHEMRLHVIDEEEDLFPLLRRRGQGDEVVGEVLGRLALDHELDAAMSREIVQGLAAVIAAPAGADMPEALREVLRALARNQRQHVALENAVVIPLAKQRLTREDLRNLSLRMAARRGVMVRLKEHEPA